MDLNPDDQVLLAVALANEAEIQYDDALQQMLAYTRKMERTRRRRRRRQRRSCWVRSWLTEEERHDHSHYYNIVQKLKNEEPNIFQNYMRMPGQLFDEILDRIRHRIVGEGSNYRTSLEPGLKLALTLRHLATGDQYPSMAFNYRVSKSAIHYIVPKVCKAIIAEYRDEVFKTPSTPAEWKHVAAEFERRWQVPHALGALDGKHVKIRQPVNSGSEYWCVYKHCYSIILMALVDSDYKFIWADTGGIGHQSDAQIFNSSSLKEQFDNGTIGVPEVEAVERVAEGEEHGDAKKLPYFMLGDDAFALRTYMMKPWAKRNMTKEELIYNYRISRGRRVVENAFGIMANRWRCLLTVLNQAPDVVQDIVECCIVLHNLLRLRNPEVQNVELDQHDANGNILPGPWRQGVNVGDGLAGPPAAHNRDTAAAKQQRQYLQEYFNAVGRGAVAWQDAMVTLRPDAQ